VCIVQSPGLVRQDSGGGQAHRHGAEDETDGLCFHAMRYPKLGYPESGDDTVKI